MTAPKGCAILLNRTRQNGTSQMSQIAVAWPSGHEAAAAARPGRVPGVILNGRAAAGQMSAEAIGPGGAVSRKATAKFTGRPGNPARMASPGRHPAAGEGSDIDGRQDVS